MVSRKKLKEPIEIKDTLLIVDFLSMYYRGAHVHNGLEYEGIPTGGLFGIVQQLTTTISKTNPTDIIFCSDLKPYFRTLEYPAYKIGREKNKDEEALEKMLAERKVCKGFIKKLCIPFIERKGLEADDLIAMLIKKFHKEYKRIVIASGDSDLYQLFIYKNISLYQGAQKGFYTPEDFKKNYPTLKSPAQWNDVLAYSGGHNGLNGIKGIGIKTGIKIVTGAPLSAKIRLDVQVNIRKITLNKKLGALPFYTLKSHVVNIPIVTKYNERDVIRFLSKYGIKMTAFMSECFSLVHE